MEVLQEPTIKGCTIDASSIYFSNSINELPWKVYYSLGGSTIFSQFQEQVNLSLNAIKMIGKLQEFKKLEDGWDSYGADAPSDRALNNAKGFIRRTDGDNLEVYFVAPGRSGEVMVEFKGFDQKAAEIYFNPDNSKELLLFDGDECLYEGVLDYQKLISFLI
jgi:hypothetical protein